jgi:hypothetical protein
VFRHDPVRLAGSIAGTPRFAGSKLSVVRFNLEWLTDGKDSLK